MAKYFKVKTNYLKTDTSNENGVSKVSEIRLFESVDYIDAQKQVIDIINNKGCCGECDLEIQKVSYDYILHKNSEESLSLNFVKKDQKDSIEEIETYWYEAKVTKLITTDKEEEKYITLKYLVEGEDLEDALTIIRYSLREEDENYWWFSSIQETLIQEVLLFNSNLK